MSDLISRQAAIDAVGYYSLHSGSKLLFADKPLKELPPAQPEKGRWILGICDNCGYDWGKDAPIASVPNYCPNCGHYHCLLKNPKGVPENEYSCAVCDSDFCAVTVGGFRAVRGCQSPGTALRAMSTTE